ncbi:hypothetical protein IAD21_03718 [Abditibacteriota bacterium]|nr:hypothetical protein IAD21_03718 [Abditibacteriota bacterium]
MTAKRPRITSYTTAQLTDFPRAVIDAHIGFLVASDKCISFVNDANARETIPAKWHHEIYDGRRTKEEECRDERDALLKRMGYDVKKVQERFWQLNKQFYELMEQRKKARK